MEFNEIVKYAYKSVDPPEDCSLPDLCAYHCMRSLLYQYNARRISQEYASEQKNKLRRLHDRATQEEESVRRSMQTQIENINRTVELRVKLNKASRDHDMSKTLWLEAIECIGRLCGSTSELKSCTKYLEGVAYEEQETLWR